MKPTCGIVLWFSPAPLGGSSTDMSGLHDVGLLGISGVQDLGGISGLHTSVIAGQLSSVT